MCVLVKWPIFTFCSHIKDGTKINGHNGKALPHRPHLPEAPYDETNEWNILPHKIFKLISSMRWISICSLFFIFLLANCFGTRNIIIIIFIRNYAHNSNAKLHFQIDEIYLLPKIARIFSLSISLFVFNVWSFPSECEKFVWNNFLFIFKIHVNWLIFYFRCYFIICFQILIKN